MVGILLGYLLSYLFIEEVGGWRSMYGAAILPALALFAGMVCPVSVFLPSLLLCMTKQPHLPCFKFPAVSCVGYFSKAAAPCC